ncbi:phosphotransferase family protein [Acidocella sp. KAb 2-4]|uniref:phosphotransferase family protein n=1 Tax=Acidocella sp. KAb 2-4 TaxID=2885158 RepID=UPI001D06F28B|nr:phosphotransferase family protein [Acidocella sp. KAb 2-4]MCB5945649.1 phosphotransferase family protein [Acidocella sp. KAb 2-4]
MNFNATWLQNYLSDRLGRAVTVLSLESFPRGSSRETWFGAYRLGNLAPPVEIVLRADHPSGAVDPTPLEQEFFIYERLGGAGLPVARALWWEDDPAWAPRPFYIREKIEGSWNIPHYSDPAPEYDALRIAVAKAHVEALAKVHAVDWQALGFAERLPVPVDATQAARNYVDAAKARYNARDGESLPIFLEAGEWLVDHAPTAARVCLCKGTNGLGEEVFRDGKVVALSDWEEVSIGDPASDFAFMQGFAEPRLRDGKQIWGMEQALDHYREVTGVTIQLSSVRYYQVVRALNLVVMARNSAANIHAKSAVGHIRQAWTGTEVIHIAKQVLGMAMGLVPPLGPERFAELNQTVDTQ